MKAESLSTRYFLIGQASLLISVLLCIIILPQGLFANDGISYYSSHKATILPYILGLLSVALFSFKLSRSLPGNSHLVLRLGFKTITFLIIAVVIVPYGISYTFEYIHTLLSAALFLVQFLMMWWLAFKIKTDIINLALLLLLAAEMIITVMYLDPKAGYLLEGEVAFQLTFGLAAYRTIKYVIENQDRKRALSS